MGLGAFAILTVAELAMPASATSCDMVCVARAMLAQFPRGRSYASPESIRAAADFLERFPNRPYCQYLRQEMDRVLHDKVGRNRATKEEPKRYEKLKLERTPNQVRGVQATTVAAAGDRCHERPIVQTSSRTASSSSRIP